MVAVFNYAPLYGLTLAFKKFNAGLGIMGSPWVGLDVFKKVVTDSYFWYVFWNTIKISLLYITFTFPMPILVALFFNELRSSKLQKTLQTVYTFPHFLSWIILSGIFINFLDINGPFNAVLSALGMEKVLFLGEKELFIPILLITSIWKGAGWGSIVYLAAIAGIDAELYEAAELDGANRWQKMFYITVPSIATTICMLLVLQIGQLINSHFDQIFNMSNPVVAEVADTIGVYTYRITFQSSASDFSFTTAVGLFTSVINFMLLTIANVFSKKVQGVGVLEGGK
ncbi:MAG: sugar ABC transporter permease [Clostridia bacterium]|nr:sugar ABC transporter permease [Clostridia bacterium]